MAKKKNNNNRILAQKYLTINFIGLSLIGSVFVYAALVEIIKRWFAPFTGFAHLPKETVDILRYVFLAVSFGNFFIIKIIQKKILSQPQPNLATLAVITYGFCEVPAVLGLALFLMAGQSLNFYMFMCLSLFYFYLFFPKYADWERIAGSPLKPPK